MSGQAPLILVCANSAWNLVNFRAGLIQNLIVRGFRVLSAAPADPPMERKLRELGCECITIPIDAAGTRPLRDIETLRALVRVMREQRPAAFLSWTIKPNVYGAIAARLTGVEAIPNVSGLGTVFIRRNAITAVSEHLYRFAFSRTKQIFFQNNDDLALFVNRRLVRQHQAKLLPGSGVDVQRFAASGCFPEGAPRRFVMITRLIADKGVREFVAAARAVKERYPEAVFTIVGAAEVANRTAIPIDEIETWVKEGLIEYRPPVDDVRPAMEEADFVVLPSYREGMSKVLLEAAAMSRPIVTTNVPGCRDIVEDGVNGFLCEPRSAASLADALFRAANIDRATWVRLGGASRSRAVQDFSEAVVIRMYVAALREAGVHGTRTQPLPTSVRMD